MTIDEMKKRKIELGYTNRDISEKSGVPVSTLQKIFPVLQQRLARKPCRRWRRYF